MVATGTGYAPFRAFAQERTHLITKSLPSKIGKMTLFFGCRKREEDYIYADEIMDQNSCGTYCAVFEAFSREDVIHRSDPAKTESLCARHSRAQRRYDQESAIPIRRSSVYLRFDSDEQGCVASYHQACSKHQKSHFR